MKTRIAITALVAALVAGTAAAGPTAWAGTKDTHGRGYNLSTSVERWDPCQPITVKVNLNGLPKSELTLMRGALAQVSKAIGIPMTYIGPSATLPTRDIYAHDPDAMLTIAFAEHGKREGQTTRLGPYTTLSAATHSSSTPSGHNTTSATILFNSRYIAVNPKGVRTALYLYGLGLALGLDDADGANIMNGPSYHQFTLGKGDKAGLAVLGQHDAPCSVASPTPAAEPTPEASTHAAQPVPESLVQRSTRSSDALLLSAHAGALTTQDKAALDSYLRKWAKDKTYYYYASTPHKHSATQTKFARLIAAHMSSLGYSHISVQAEPSGMGSYGIPLGMVKLTFEH